MKLINKFKKKVAPIYSRQNEYLLVYSDLLQSKGDPRGEIIALEIALDTKRISHSDLIFNQLQKFYRECKRYQYEIPAAVKVNTSVVWKYGFIKEVKFREKAWLYNSQKLFGGNDLSLLSKVDLSELKIQKIPEWIFKLPNLRELNLATNRLISIPSKISSLKTLEHLDLSDNLLSDLSPEIMQLENLAEFRIEGNQINEIPEKLEQFELQYIQKIQNIAISLLRQGQSKDEAVNLLAQKGFYRKFAHREVERALIETGMDGKGESDIGQIYDWYGYAIWAGLFILIKVMLLIVRW